jgi:hypothetical protein
MNTTTRKHPRTLAEAFPRTTEYACSVEHHKAVGSTVADYLVAVVLGLLGAIWLFFFLSY